MSSQTLILSTPTKIQQPLVKFSILRSPMASKAEGIALLSMYNDEDEEDEEEEQQQDQETRIDEESSDLLQNIVSDPVQDQIPSKSPQTLSSPSPEIKSLRSPTPPPWPESHRSSPSPGLPPRPLSERVAIVDYAHDEAALSPEAEEGEIMSSGRVVVSMEIQASDGNLEERTPPGTVQLLTPSIQTEPPQPSDVPGQSRSENSMAIDSTGTDPDIAQAEIAIVVSEEVQKDDPLKKFLPPPVTTTCPEELQIKINKFLAFKKSGKSFNAALRNRKDYRNPDFLQHAVRYQDIDQIGTCFDKDVFDPHGYDKSDYFDEIEADMKREIERKDQERKKCQKVDFVPGGTQPGTVAPALKIGAQIQVAVISAAVTSGSQSVSAAADSTKEIRQNKKTKWDKIDGDVKNPMISGENDNLSSVDVHAAHLSAANAGTGCTGFAQQKRREAEEKRSGESKSKFDK